VPAVPAVSFGDVWEKAKPLAAHRELDVHVTLAVTNH